MLNCRCLKHICLDSPENNGNDYIGDELLDYLTKFSPNSLTEIYISSNWKYSVDALERFFESCRGRTLLKFGFTLYNEYYITKDHEEVFEKYIREGVILSYVRD